MRGPSAKCLRLRSSPPRITKLNFALAKVRPNRVRTESELLANLQARKSGRLQTQHRVDGFGRRRLAAHGDASLLEPLGDCRAITAEFSS